MSTPDSPLPIQSERGTEKRTSKSLPSVILLSILIALLLSALIYLATRQPQSNTQSSDITELKSLINAQRQQLGLSTTGDNRLSANELFQRIDKDTNTLSLLFDGLETQFSQKDGIILEKQNALDTVNRTREALEETITSLTEKLSASKQSSANALLLESELETKKRQLESLNNQIRILTDQLNGQRLALREASGIKAERDIALKKIEELKQQLLGNVDQARLEELISENTRLRTQLQGYRAQVDRDRLFSKDISSLSPNAAALFQKLASLEGLSDQERRDAYDRIKLESGSFVRKTIPFSTGSSSIAYDTEKNLLSALSTLSPSDQVLVIGYASKSGSVDSNRELSSGRATTVASVIDAFPDTKGKVNAVYLGQTDRFSQENDSQNQVCEVWILK